MEAGVIFCLLAYVFSFFFIFVSFLLVWAIINNKDEHVQGNIYKLRLMEGSAGMCLSFWWKEMWWYIGLWPQK
jgi:hypothetical protein